MENKKTINPKIIFMGTPEFGAIVLEEISKKGHIPCLVLTNPDKPSGRKKITTSSPVKIVAQKYNIPLAQPEKIKDVSDKIKKLNPDLIVVAAYGKILPKNILDIPKCGSLNIHPSLLPKYRGASPIQATILNGDKKTGVTIILMDEKMDHGPIITSRELKIINYEYSYKQLSEKLAYLGAKLLIETIPKWINGKIKARPQEESKATYTKIIKKEDGKIDWSKPAEKIERQIRAFSPWPGCFTFFKKNNKILRVKIIEAEVSKKSDPKKISVKCGKDYLIIKKLQPEGKSIISAEDFKHGYNPIL